MEENEVLDIPEIIVNAKNIEEPGVLEALIPYIVGSNQGDYNITKCIEELNELATVLGQYINKKGSKKQPSKQEIIDEIGDVKCRLEFILIPAAGIFKEEDDAHTAVEARAGYKIMKYYDFVREGKYIGKI